MATTLSQKGRRSAIKPPSIASKAITICLTKQKPPCFYKELIALHNNGCCEHSNNKPNQCIAKECKHIFKKFHQNASHSL